MWGFSLSFMFSSLENETKKALEEIGKLFPVEAFEGRLPQIVLRHQLYSVVKNKTQCDKELVNVFNIDIYSNLK